MHPGELLEHQTAERAVGRWLLYSIRQDSIKLWYDACSLAMLWDSPLSQALSLGLLVGFEAGLKCPLYLVTRRCS